MTLQGDALEEYESLMAMIDKHFFDTRGRE